MRCLEVFDDDKIARHLVDIARVPVLGKFCASYDCSEVLATRKLKREQKPRAGGTTISCFVAIFSLSLHFARSQNVENVLLIPGSACCAFYPTCKASYGLVSTRAKSASQDLLFLMILSWNSIAWSDLTVLTINELLLEKFFHLHLIILFFKFVSAYCMYSTFHLVRSMLARLSQDT